MAEGIRLSRKSSWIYCLRKFNVLLDGKKAGSIGNGQNQLFALPPGRHDVRIQVSWCKSKTVTVDVPPGTEVNLECGSPLGWGYIASFGTVLLVVMFAKGDLSMLGNIAALLVGVFWMFMSFREDSFVYLRGNTSPSPIKDS